VENSTGQTGIESLRLEVNGHRVRYLKAGSGPPVVLLHGGASDSRDWIPTMEALADRFGFYAPDLLGFGESDRKESGYYLYEYSDFIVGFMEKLQLEKAALVGHSFGGRVCLDTAIKYRERADKIILIDSAGLGKISRLGNVLHTGFWALRKLFNKPQPFPKFLAAEGEDYNHVGDEALRQLTTPTLLVWKRYDPYLPISIARRTAKLIPGARLVEVPGIGHAPNKQNRPAFHRLMLEFLDHA
jgi:pimeloyl-ACP methyl ester carboxylesterase